MPPDVPLHFGPYTLAGPQGPLWRAAEVVPLPPKALAVLWRLASQAVSDPPIERPATTTRSTRAARSA